MDYKQAKRIEMYLLNSSVFMWGLGPGNQRKNYDWLEDKGFKFTRARYGLVIKQLIHHPGISILLKDLIIPIIVDYFPTKTMDILRDHWNNGEWPSLKILNDLIVKGKGEAGPDRAFYWRPFIEIDTQFHYVKHWGEFAGIWFLEIEPEFKEYIDKLIIDNK